MLIAQITDPHITAGRRFAYRRVDTATALERCIAALESLDPRPDVVLMTGDLTDVGQPEEYGLLREILTPLSIPFHMVPGNHDDRRNLHAAFPAAAPVNADGFVQYGIEAGPLRLVGLDTVTTGRPEGELCPRRLAWLADELAREPERPRLLFQHHPPFRTGIRHMDVQNLVRGGDALAALVQQAPGVQAILCGHLHRSIFARFGGVLVSTAVAPAHQVTLDLRPDAPPSFTMEPPGFHLHLWSEEQGLVTHVAPLGSYDGPYPFFGEGGDLLV